MRQDQAKTKSRNLKQPTRQDAIKWVSNAWDSITPDILISSFKVCGISNALDGTEDDMVSDYLLYVDSEPAEDQESESDGDKGDTHTADDDDDVDDIDPFRDDSDSDSD